jgi:hypothetical protein
MAPLATISDLQVRGVNTTNADLADAMLDAASEVVRAAAGVPISRTTSTVELAVTEPGQYLRLPGPPIRAVTSVKVGEVEIEDWVLVDDALWRSVGWSLDCPVVYTVTYEHGLDPVPADIVDLVCSLAAAGIAAAQSGGSSVHAGVQSERMGDYSITYSTGTDATTSVMELTPMTRARLRARFGGGAGMVISR